MVLEMLSTVFLSNGTTLELVDALEKYKKNGEGLIRPLGKSCRCFFNVSLFI
jgi:hypothetical protein